MCLCDSPWENMKFKKKIRLIAPSVHLTEEFLFLSVTSRWSKMQFTCCVCVFNSWPIAWFIIVVRMSGPNWIKFGMYTKWGILKINVVIKLVSDVHLINYSRDLSNLWRSDPNWMKCGVYTKWLMLSPNMVSRLVCDVNLINYSWDLSNISRGPPNYVCVCLCGLSISNKGW